MGPDGTRLLATPVWWFYVFWLPDYLSKERGFTLLQIGLFGWIPYLTVDLGKLMGGACRIAGWSAARARRWPRKSVMAAGAIAMACGIFVVNASTAGTAIAWVSIATFGFGMWSANILALHADIFPADSTAGAVGTTGMAASLGGAARSFVRGGADGGRRGLRTGLHHGEPSRRRFRLHRAASTGSGSRRPRLRRTGGKRTDDAWLLHLAYDCRTRSRS